MLHDCAAAGGIVMHALDDQDEYAPASAQPLEALEPVLSQNGSVNGVRADANGAHGVPANGHADVNGAIQLRDASMDIARQKEG